MFNQLLESKPKKQKSVGGTIFSLVFHAAVISAAVYGTLNAKEALEKPKQEEVKFVEVEQKKEPPPPEPEKAPPPPDVTVAPPPPKGFQVLTAPVNVPDVIPDIDLTKSVTDAADFSGKGVAGGVAKGVEGGTGPVQTDQPYFEFQVEKPVVAAGNCSPRYPDILRSANVEGEVLAQFIVDADGKVEPNSIKPLKSTHDLFMASVRSTLLNCRYIAAEVGGRKVKQLVQQPFQFALQH